MFALRRLSDVLLRCCASGKHKQTKKQTGRGYCKRYVPGIQTEGAHRQTSFSVAMASLEQLLEAGGAPPAEGGKVAYEHPLVER